MGIFDRPVPARDGVSKCNLTPRQNRRQCGDGHDSHFRNQRIDDDQEVRPLQTKRDATARLMDDTIRRDKRGCTRRYQNRARASASRSRYQYRGVKHKSRQRRFHALRALGRKRAYRLHGPINRIHLAEGSKCGVIRRRVVPLRECLSPGQYSGQAIRIGGLKWH
jgi:hypothetical protein